MKSKQFLVELFSLEFYLCLVSRFPLFLLSPFSLRFPLPRSPRQLHWHFIENHLGALFGLDPVG